MLVSDHYLKVTEFTKLKLNTVDHVNNQCVTYITYLSIWGSKLKCSRLMNET